MPPLAEYARRALEWEPFLALLAPYAASPLGDAWLRELAPSDDLAAIEREHTLVAEMRLLLSEGIRPTLGGLDDPSELLAKSRLPGAALEPAEIAALTALADILSSWAATLRSPPDRVKDAIPSLLALSEPILHADLHTLVISIRAKMLPDGTLADTASPELGRIRREIDRQQRAIEDSLRSALRRLADDGSAQQELITIRGDRFVIPVKAEARRRVPGVVHGASSSGQTVYLEPLETLELNNELVRLFDEESGEIHRIFVAITKQFAAEAPVLAPGAQILATVETLLIRARFADEYDAIRPRFTTGPQAELRLVAARHPLLEHRLKNKTAYAAGGHFVAGDRSQAPPPGAPHLASEMRASAEHQNFAPAPQPSPSVIVPLSIALEPHARQLIISGPNTGGKTVGLKTTGLLTLMAQSGIPVPAFEATLPVCTQILADIGDAQSIEQNLSTFSAHITNLNRLARLAGPETLVLLDELGSATDPDEGSALAVAIAEHFLAAGAFTIISTHLGALKIWAETTPGVANAAVGFNAQTLAPTYELRQGVPGASAGIQIAARLGLSPEIIARARSRMSTQALDVSAFLDKLHAEIAALGEERLSIAREERALRAERHHLETEGMQEWRNRSRELERELNATLRELDQQAKLAGEAIEDRAAREKAQVEAERRAAQLRREFSEKFTAQIRSRRPSAVEKAAALAAAHTRDPRRAAVGDTIKLRIGQQGRVTRELDADTVEVTIGSIGHMKMRVRRAEIAAILQSPATARGPSPVETARQQRNITIHTADPDRDLRPEINVIGLTADHAEDEVTKFVDQAFLAGLQRVRVVHGTGMGVLRRTLRAALGRHPHVATVTEADTYEGGQGATIVELRS